MMDLIYNLAYYLALFLIPFVIYFLLFKKNNGRSVYTGRDWFYLIKLYFAHNAVRLYQDKFRNQISTLKEEFDTGFNIPTDQHTNSQIFHGVDQNGNSISLKFTLRNEKIAEVSLYLRLSDGNVYTFPEENGLRLTKILYNEWKINGMNIEILEPFTRLRIIFNGLLRNVSMRDSERIEYVQFSLIFNCSGSPTYIPQKMDTTLLADALAKENWRDGSWTDYLVNQCGYEQFGVLQGYIKGDSYPSELILNMPTCRTIHRGIDNRFLLKRALNIFIADNYGNLINVVIKSFKKGCYQMNYGSAILSNNTILPIKGVDIQLKSISEHKILPEMLITEIQVQGKIFKCVIHLNTSKSLVTTNSEENGFECYNVPAECDVNTNQARAVVEFWYNKNGTFKFVPNVLLPPKSVEVLPEHLIVNIKSEEAKILLLTGGKGNSLALLSTLTSSDFIVPDGFIITVNAFKRQLQSDTNLAKTLLCLDDICRTGKEKKIESLCNEVVSHFKKEKILPEIIEAIVKELNIVGKSKDTLGWAVRSSAIGEDSEELSAAGQNETFLGCMTEEQVLKAVAVCWASLFSYQSVQYRRNHGIPILSEMAVVVQKMVPAESAGVLFSCHPFSFNPSQVVITSNYGLGETVVSGKSDPDTFVLSRTWDDKISLLDHNIGRKNKILKMTNNGVEEIVNDEKSESENKGWSISEKQALHLGKVGLVLEKAFGGSRDIEWAFYNDKLYLLQSRPITTLNSWSEFDLTHELDYPVRSGYTVLSTGNIGEVMPNALSVLTQTSSFLSVMWAMQLRFKNDYDPLSLQYLLRRQHKGLIDVVHLIHNNIKEDVMVSSTILDLAIFGHPVLDENMNDICKKIKGVSSPIDIMKSVTHLLSLAIRNNFIYRKMEETVSELKIYRITDSHIATYETIGKILNKLPHILQNHTETSSVSSFYQVLVLNILLEGSKTLTQQHYIDFATILSSCNDVISAEVPIYLANIAKIIRDEGYDEQFCTIKPEFGVTFLETKCPEAFKLFKKFLKKHGHRSRGEFEIMEKSWSENPSEVISMIQANARHETSISKSIKTPSEIVKSLLSPKSKITRSVIKFIINRIQSSVAIRELTKYELVRAFSILKQMYRALSKQMVSEGLLPSPDLIYHLTHYEIGQVIKKRSPLLITKAIKRKKLYPKWNRIKFPEINFGVPVPENEVEHSEAPLDKICVGTAASAGTVKARACVIRSLEEIDQLQTGDILITVSTDISWSPYFPILAGIVTELGGLISHGAVVAREYGLPCIVGVKEATKVFRTGDIVVLSGSTGKVGKAADFLEVL